MAGSVLATVETGRRLAASALLLVPCALAAQTLLVDATTGSGIDFAHRVFAGGEKHMPENMGAGVALFDYDGDGVLDVYLVQGAPVVGAPPAEAANRLYRGLGDATFVEVTERAGVGDRGLGMGVAVGDFDGDGFEDLFVTNFGPDVLYRNLGDGTFADVTAEAGVAGSGWSTGAAFVDLDGDGDLDLFVARYLAYDPADNRFCGNAQTGLRAYCHPDVYGGATDALYVNEGNGRFRDVSATAGLVPGDDSRGLGVAVADLDGDGALDLYVANDTTANHLYSSHGEGLREGALLAGLAVNGSGRGEASMGIAVADLDGDLAGEVFVTHLDEETNTLYRPLAPGLYADATEAAGLATPSRPWVGFGTSALDADLDGDLDLLVANGHIIDNIADFDPALRHPQPLQLLVNDGRGRFVEATERVAVDGPLVGRGLATGDLDGDGARDAVVTQNGGRALLLEAVPPAGARFVAVDVVRPGAGEWGSRWIVVDGADRQVRWLLREPSYLSQGASEMGFGVRGGTVDVVRDGGEGGVRRHRGLPTGRRLRFAAGR